MMIVFFYFGFACVCGVLANTRGRNGFGWFVLGLLISPILAGVAVILPVLILGALLLKEQQVHCRSALHNVRET
jgi:hypothetical protein